MKQPFNLYRREFLPHERNPLKAFHGPVNPPGLKYCSACDSLLEFSAFGKAAKNSDGLLHVCKPCNNRRSAARYVPTPREVNPKRPEIIPEGKKWCNQCETVKDKSDFSANKNTPDGLSFTCKPCAKRQRDASREKNRQRNLANGPADSRKCPRCSKTKSADGFFLTLSTPSGLSYYCKDCTYERTLELRATPEGRIQRRNHWLRSRYGITLEEYEAMLLAQNSRCAICGTDECDSGKNFAVDHNHKTGKVRALLCDVCNTTLGKLNEDPAVMRAMADYIEMHNAADSMLADRSLT